MSVEGLGQGDGQGHGLSDFFATGQGQGWSPLDAVGQGQGWSPFSIAGQGQGAFIPADAWLSEIFPS